MTINEIISKFKTDAAFAEKYSALNGVDAILEQAKKDGFDVTAADVQAAVNELAKNTGELSEGELSAVAGGKGNHKCGTCGADMVHVGGTSHCSNKNCK